MFRPMLALIASLMLLVGCGSSDEDTVRTAVEDFYAALVNGNGDRGCELMSSEARKEFPGAAGMDCGDLMDRVQAEQPDAAPEVTTVAVDGDRATVGIERGGQSGRVVAVKEGGDWRIADF